MNDRIRKAGTYLRDTYVDAAEQARDAHDTEMQRRGFKSAAYITFNLIDTKLDAFREQMKTVGLTKGEQAAYAQLDELRSEFEADCDRYWRTTNVDWRPQKVVARAVRVEPEELEP